ncbi:ABC transporter substrate-binding protein [Pseudomonas veronii 1YdBTEX2]|uniref:High-affinity zinc uptake system protein ZnuA n=1 Tax=Pseudomonas veronii 1YdBTEX2 TaxID=1295141 RepID=A0A1D3K0P6_PSEVE|nr:ABC transporter substrate-binding protein [Pseudomonas veronii 1YdBTEX2]
MSISSPLVRLLLVSLISLLLAPLANAEAAKRLRIGITLHPYYSYVANIVGDKAEVVPLIPAGFNPHAYEPRADDIKRIGTLDVIVLNGVGHDDFADRMIATSERPDIPVIEANANVPLLAATGNAARGAGKVVNPHTFLSISASIAQVNNIARELGKLDPDNAKTYTQNARAYGKRLRQMRAEALAKLTRAPNPDLRVATVHAAYDYLLREFGLEVTAVVEPAHGIEPSPSQLKKTIDELRALDVKVIFSEMDFPSTYVETIQRESGVRLYPLSHISYGEYSAEKYEVEMTGNLNTVVRAIQESGHDGGATLEHGQRRPDDRLRQGVADPGPHRDPRWRELPGAAGQHPCTGGPERRWEKLADQDAAGANAAPGATAPDVAGHARHHWLCAPGAGVRPRPADDRG